MGQLVPPSIEFSVGKRLTFELHRNSFWSALHLLFHELVYALVSWIDPIALIALQRSAMEFGVKQIKYSPDLLNVWRLNEVCRAGLGQDELYGFQFGTEYCPSVRRIRN